MINKLYIASIFLLLNYFQASANELDDDQYELQWYTYSQEYDSFVPTKKVSKKVSFFVTDEMEDSKLTIKAPEQTAIFINNNLWKTIDSITVIDIDSLLISNNKEVFITLFHAKSLRGLKTNITSKVANQNLDKLVINRITGENDFFLMTAIVLLIVAGILKRNMSFQYAYILGIKQLYLSQLVDNPIYSNSFFSRESIQFYSLISAIIGLELIYFIPTINIFISPIDNYSWGSYFGHWLYYSIIVYAIFYLKYLSYNFLCGVYNFRKFTLIQNYDFMRIVIYVSILYFFLMLLDMLIIDVSFTFLLLMPFFIQIIYLLTTFRKLNKLYSHTKLHLFSYLCVSEIVPGLFFTGILG